MYREKQKAKLYKCSITFPAIYVVIRGKCQRRCEWHTFPSYSRDSTIMHFNEEQPSEAQLRFDNKHKVGKALFGDENGVKAFHSE